MTPWRGAAIAVAALAAGGAVMALIITSDHQDAKAVWAVFGPAVGWIFVGTGLYAWAHRPENPTGALMVLMGFTWYLIPLSAADTPLLHAIAMFASGLFGAVFLRLALGFPSGWVQPGRDRALVLAGYLIFPLAFVPSVLFAAPEDIGCAGCPHDLVLIERNDTLALVLRGVGAALYLGLFVFVFVRALQRWRQADPFERLQLTPVYASAFASWLLVTAAEAGAGGVAWWGAFISAAVLPFAFLGGLLRSHVSHLDAELAARIEELRASRARIVQAADEERRRLERDLHDGAQARLVGLALLLRAARKRAETADPELAELLDRAQEELQTGLSELRELARGIHPAVLTDRGLEPALNSLVARVPVPVTLEVDEERLPPPVESAAYFVVSEALANVAKYAQATHATVEVRRVNGRVTVDVTDDGVGGADATRGSGLRGLEDRVSALDGTISLHSPPGRGTRLHAEIPVRR